MVYIYLKSCKAPFPFPVVSDSAFLTSVAFLWKVVVITLVSCLPLYIAKYLRRKYAPSSYSKLTWSSTWSPVTNQSASWLFREWSSHPPDKSLISLDWMAEIVGCGHFRFSLKVCLCGNRPIASHNIPLHSFRGHFWCEGSRGKNYSKCQGNR